MGILAWGAENKSMLRSLGWHLNHWASLVLEAPCPLCRRFSPQSLCGDCARRVQDCAIAPEWQQHSIPVLPWGRYEGSLKRAIAALKYEANPYLAHPLGDWLAASWKASQPPATPLTVVPIPLHREKLKTRGFNQAEWLARRFCAQTKLPLLAHGLERIRATQAQFQVAGRDRQQNLQGAFRVGQSLLTRKAPTSVLLLDDIYTTGATAYTAAQTLRQQGIAVRGMVVLAMAYPDRRA